jgi:nicotinamidase-related amidase
MQPTQLPHGAALLVIDMQLGFGPDYWDYWAGPGGVRNNPSAEAVVAALQRSWRASGRPLIHVQHDSTNPASPLRPGHAGHPVHPDLVPLPDEPVYHKRVNSAFIGTTLEADLRALGIDTLVIVGIQTNHCVSTTARMAGNLGFRTYVVADGTATFDREGPDGTRYTAEVMHGTALATLHGEFATVVLSTTLLESASP